MHFNWIEKFGLIFRYLISSFLSLEMFLFSFLFLAILIVNVKRKNKYVDVLSVCIFLGFVLGIILSNYEYVCLCMNGFVKKILNYVYFPSTLVYFFIIIFVTFMLIYTIFSQKLTAFKKIVNYTFFSILYFFFMSFVVISAYQGIDLSDVVHIYQNDTILAIVQVSNLLLVIWIVYTAFYYLYCYFKRKFD